MHQARLMNYKSEAKSLATGKCYDRVFGLKDGKCLKAFSIFGVSCVAELTCRWTKGFGLSTIFLGLKMEEVARHASSKADKIQSLLRTFLSSGLSKPG